MAVFYRQYRPQKLNDLVGQEIIADILLSQLTSGKFGHGYLFYGPKGTGKTSTARILAKALNCQKYPDKKRDDKIKLGEPCNKCLSCTSIVDGSNLDLIEIDAASNRGIDEIRDLREKIKLSPVSSRFKVYIIDEAHMLTTEAFNALLKTLEEPPAHAVFILATTEYGKLPQTIVSRLQKFNFARANKNSLVKVINKIAKSENVKIEDEAINQIAEVADGSYRDAVSIFDQLSSTKKTIKTLDVSKIARSGGWSELYNFIDLLADKKLKESVMIVENLGNEGGDISYFAKQIVLFLEKLLFIKIGITDGWETDLSKDQLEKMSVLSDKFESAELQSLTKQFLVAESEIKLYPLPQIPLVLTICKYIPEEASNEEEEVEKIDELRMVEKSQKVINSPPTVKSSKVVSNGVHIGEVKQIEKKWDKFLDKVKPINAHVVALLRSTRPLSYKGSQLTLEVFYRFHKQKLEEPKIINMLDTVMADVMEKNIKLRFILADKDANPPKAVSKSDVVEISNDDLEQVAQEIFSK